MVRELDLVALLIDLPVHGLIRGDVGAIVLVHDGGAAFEVEFVRADGRTIALETLTAVEIEPLAGQSILHVRKLAVA